MTIGAETVYYDLSRLIERLEVGAPSGIDRVDLRYALWSRKRAMRWIGVVQRPGGMEALPAREAAAVLSFLETRWIGPSPGNPAGAKPLPPPSGWKLETLAAIFEKAARVSLLERLRGRGWGTMPAMLFPRLLSRWLQRMGNEGSKIEFGEEGVYWNIGHVFRFEKACQEAGRIWGSRSVVFLHDVIPLLYPDTQRELSRRHFEVFFKWMVALQGKILMSSKAAVADLRALAGNEEWNDAGSLSRIVVNPLAVEAKFFPSVVSGARRLAEPPCFLIIGTWEPRKHFEMLLEVWESFRKEGNSKIVLTWLGRPSEMTRASRKRFGRLVDKGWADARGPVSDEEMLSVMGGARALLFPSSAEGWGLPLAEAMAMGLPAITSDRPVCREVSRGLVEYLPLNAPATWKKLILDYAGKKSVRRAAQVERLQGFQNLTWATHFEALERTL